MIDANGVIVFTDAIRTVGKGLLYEALQHPTVESAFVINRKPCGVAHPKLTKIIRADFFNLTSSLLLHELSYQYCSFTCEPHKINSVR